MCLDTALGPNPVKPLILLMNLVGMIVASAHTHPPGVYKPTPLGRGALGSMK